MFFDESKYGELVISAETKVSAILSPPPDDDSLVHRMHTKAKVILDYDSIYETEVRYT